MREPHVTKPVSNERSLASFIAFSLGAIIFLYFVLPWLVLHPAAGCLFAGVVLLGFALCAVVSACMLSSKI